MEFTRYYFTCYFAGLTTTELKEELKQRLPAQLKKWDTKAEKEVFHQRERELYINRSLKATVMQGEESQQMKINDMLQLLQESPRNTRIIVTGEAGSGKTSLLRHIANSWLQTEEVPYDFVFHVPLGKSRCHSISEIICQDLQLLPVQCIDSLSEMLCLSSKHILFLLDSYEELRHKTKALEKLITGDMYPHSVVVVTTRPGSNLAEITQRMPIRIETQLQDFSEEEMARYLQVYLFQNQQGKVPEIAKHFFGNDFLLRPFNLALACYLYDVHRVQDGEAAPMEMLATQTVLLNQILQHMMQAYVRKQKGLDVPLTTGSPLENGHFPAETKAMLKEISRMAYHAF